MYLQWLLCLLYVFTSTDLAIGYQTCWYPLFKEVKTLLGVDTHKSTHAFQLYALFIVSPCTCIAFKVLNFHLFHYKFDLQCLVEVDFLFLKTKKKQKKTTIGKLYA